MTRSTIRAASRLLGASGLVLALSFAPIELDPISGTLVLKSADARGGNGGGNGGGNDGGNGGGNGGGHGGDNGNGNGHGKDRAERGQGHGKGGFGGGGKGKSYGTLDDFAHEMRGSRGRKDFETARARYDDALGGSGRPERGHGFGQANKAADLSPEETEALMERGWKGKKTDLNDGFKNHGQRVRTMVELAKRLGYSARVGAMQGNFGTPFENGIADLQGELEATEQELADARAALEAEQDPAKRSQLEEDVQELEDRAAGLQADLDRAVAEAKPGRGPDDSWATADLDVNDDGRVDAADLDALDAPGAGDGTADAVTPDESAS